ncbi:DOMON-like domain-containing protein [Sphingopyxis sp. PET50]|uniref:DOMON-like domain-containing protein n=1 Tax=Sphingopyxis sp. PET50 TaxID=2976533 RepID=UPI0021AEF06A|nr:DOMON-like domain-containing protein [Sphingopyxis sp. PET50]
MLLTCHPDTPCSTDLFISVDAIRNRPELLYLRFIIDGDMDKIVMPPRRTLGRTDGLWQTTCCEAFLKPEGRRDYLEFNLSPSTAWASYQFDDYRAGMREADAAPNFDRVGGIFQAMFDFTDQPDLHDAAWRVGLSVVIEEKGGTKSYWALAHPPGKPDFHHPDCFALTLGAPPAA